METVSPPDWLGWSPGEVGVVKLTMGSHAASLQALLRSRLIAVMTDRGWKLDLVAESTMGTALIGAFRQQLDEEFSATASFEFDFAFEFDSRSREGRLAAAPIGVISEFGVSYDRSYRLWPLATGYPAASDLALDESEVFGHGKTLDVTMPLDKGVDAIADKLEAGAEKALGVAGRYTSVDTILARFRASDQEMDQVYAVPLLLAAAGRLEEARAAIHQYRSRRISSTHDSEYRAFVTRLSTWMDSGDPLPDPPESFTKVHAGEWFGPDYENGPPRSPAPGFWELWERSREKSEQTRAANEAVRSNKAGKSRKELAEMLQREKSERGLDTSPRFLDMQIDAIQADSRAERRAVGLKALKTFVDGITATFRGLSASGDPAPEWMEPPLKASHTIRGIPGIWITIETDPDAGPVLERALATAIQNPFRDDQIEPELWLDWRSRPTADETLLSVHLGDQRVATLDGNTAALFRIHMEAAVTEGLLPVANGRLIRTSEAPGHRLEIQRPAEPQ
jgi:hypothetical protein